MINYKVNVANEALYDLISIYNYIALELKEPYYAKNQISRIRSSISSLEVFPLRNKVVEWDPWSTIGVRQMPIDNFIIYYVVNENESIVTVLRVFYGKRDIKNIINGAL